MQGTTQIGLALDALFPEPALFPRDPPGRREVVEAESWGNEVYQPVPRRLIWAGLKRDRSTLATYLDGARTGIPEPIAMRTVAPIIAAAARFNRATDENVRRDLAALPGLFERVDALLEAGTIGAGEPNAADFQIGTTTALLATMDDVRPLLEGHPALDHAGRIAPGYPGYLPRVFPASWLVAAHD